MATAAGTHVHSSNSTRTPRRRRLARSCRLLSLEIRLALAAGGWVEDEAAVVDVGREVGAPRERGGCGGATTATTGPPSGVLAAAKDNAPLTDEAEWEACFSGAVGARRSGSQHAPELAGRAAGAPVLTDATATTTATSTAPAAAPCPTASTSTATGWTRADAPWQAPGRDAAWRARLAGVSGGGGGGAPACRLPGGGRGGDEGARRPPSPPDAPGLQHRACAQVLPRHEGAETEEKRQPRDQATCPPPQHTTIHGGGAAAPTHTTITPTHPLLLAGFDLAIQALLDARAARWGGAE